jgi:hypothetical protein
MNRFVDSATGHEITPLATPRDDAGAGGQPAHRHRRMAEHSVALESAAALRPADFLNL